MGWSGSQTTTATTATGDLYYRSKRDNVNAWTTSWDKILTSKNYSDYAATKNHTHSSLTLKYGSTPTTAWTYDGSNAKSLTIQAGNSNVTVSGTSDGIIKISAVDTTYTFTASNPTLSWGNTATIGTIGGVTFKVTMPGNPNTNTTNTAGSSTKDKSKLLLVGATSTTTGETFTNSTCYIGTDNYIYANSTRLATTSESLLLNGNNKMTGAIKTAHSGDFTGIYYNPHAAIEYDGGEANFTTDNFYNFLLMRSAKNSVICFGLDVETNRFAFRTVNNSTATYPAVVMPIEMDPLTGETHLRHVKAFEYTASGAVNTYKLNCTSTASFGDTLTLPVSKYVDISSSTLYENLKSKANHTLWYDYDGNLGSNSNNWYSCLGVNFYRGSVSMGIKKLTSGADYTEFGFFGYFSLSQSVGWKTTWRTSEGTLYHSANMEVEGNLDCDKLSCSKVIGINGQIKNALVFGYDGGNQLTMTWNASSKVLTISGGSVKFASGTTL
jgi:hypothetical protein